MKKLILALLVILCFFSCKMYPNKMRVGSCQYVIVYSVYGVSICHAGDCDNHY